MNPFPKESETTPHDVREMVDRTLDLIHEQVGSIRAQRRPVPSETVAERLEMIRQRAATGRKPRDEGGQ